MNTDNYISDDNVHINNDDYESIQNKINSISNIINSFSSVGRSSFVFKSFNVIHSNDSSETPFLLGEIVGIFSNISTNWEENARFIEELSMYKYSYITFTNIVNKKGIIITLSHDKPTNTYPTLTIPNNDLVDELDRLNNKNEDLLVILNVEPPF